MKFTKNLKKFGLGTFLFAILAVGGFASLGQLFENDQKIEVGEIFVVEGLHGQIDTFEYLGSDPASVWSSGSSRYIRLEHVETGELFEREYVRQHYAGGINYATLSISGFTHVMALTAAAADSPLVVGDNPQVDDAYHFVLVPDTALVLGNECELFASLEEGESISAPGYQVELVYVDQDEVKFVIDGQVTPKLEVGEHYTVGRATILVEEILYQGYAGGLHRASFCVSH